MIVVIKIIERVKLVYFYMRLKLEFYVRVKVLFNYVRRLRLFLAIILRNRSPAVFQKDNLILSSAHCVHILLSSKKLPNFFIYHANLFTLCNLWYSKTSDQS